jgi:LacI family transcriptional regulator
MAVRMKDIAQDLGVSLMTVSKALRNHSDISHKTRERVLQRMRELNYQPDWIARSMVTRRTYLVGLVLPDLMHSFFAEVAKGVARTLQPLGYQVVISNTEEDGEIEQKQIDVLAMRKVDGLIIASAQRDTKIFDSLAQRKIPYVLMDRTIQGVDANYVGVKDEEVGALATEHLIRQGCKRIAHLRGPALAPGEGRCKGYKKALAKYKLDAKPEYIVSAQYGDATGYEATRELLKVRPMPDGIFAYNDPVAAGAVKAILEAGLRVPEDIAIIGAGNVHYSDLLKVPLSTIDQSSGVIGETAAQLLSEIMEAKTPAEPKKIFIPPKLIVRESSQRKGSA